MSLQITDFSPPYPIPLHQRWRGEIKSLLNKDFLLEEKAVSLVLL
jgi:hypothetical protein